MRNNLHWLRDNLNCSDQILTTICTLYANYHFEFSELLNSGEFGKYFQDLRLNLLFNLAQQEFERKWNMRGGICPDLESCWPTECDLLNVSTEPRLVTASHVLVLVSIHPANDYIKYFLFNDFLLRINCWLWTLDTSLSRIFLLRKKFFVFRNVTASVEIIRTAQTSPGTVRQQRSSLSPASSSPAVTTWLPATDVSQVTFSSLLSPLSDCEIEMI